MPPPATAETHVIGWQNWRPSALSALNGVCMVVLIPSRYCWRKAELQHSNGTCFVVDSHTPLLRTILITPTYLFISFKLSRFRRVSCFLFLSTVCTLRMLRVTSFSWLPHYFVTTYDWLARLCPPATSHWAPSLHTHAMD